MTYLFLFTLGPVQGFIAQARKTHDLHSGSKLLSDLCRTAAKYFENTYGGKVIFPDINSPSIPNRFLGKITTDKDVWSIGNAVEQEVRGDWKRQFDELLAEQLDIEVYEEANRQIEQHLDIQWLFQPLAEKYSDETYHKAYDELNKNLNALKNTRPFFTPEETGRKCSLDGERNVIFYRKSLSQQVTKTNDDVQIGNPLYSTKNIVLEYNDDDSKPFTLRHLQPGEGLSAVSMLKRFQGFESANFPSTAEFALSETMQAVGTPYLERMTKLFGHNHARHLNWQVFFEDNLNPRYFEKQGLNLNKLEKAKEIQNNLATVASNKGCKLEKYYALVVFDGDFMGEWWKGARIKDDELLEQFHEDLSKCLSSFAHEVRKEYPKDDHRGWVVYAGGDDFLGFFNLHHLIKGLCFLRKKYYECVHEKLESRIKEGNLLTFSAGVCIAHYKEPLSLVLAHARELEHQAKELDVDRKNAIGLGVIPGSGQTAKVVLPFEVFPHLGTIISNLQSTDFSNAFVGKARTELAVFINKTGNLETQLIETTKSLLDRAINRACILKREEGESEDDFLKRKKKKVEPLQLAVKALLDANNHNLFAFFDALDIADFIERQTHISLPKTETIDA